MRTAALIEWQITKNLLPHNLTHSQYSLLRILREESDKGLQCGEISQRLINMTPDVTRLLDRLEKRGLIKRQRDFNDRRIVVAKITQKAIDLLAELDLPIDQMHISVFKDMSSDNVKAFIESLSNIRERLINLSHPITH